MKPMKQHALKKKYWDYDVILAPYLSAQDMAMMNALHDAKGVLTQAQNALRAAEGALVQAQEDYDDARSALRKKEQELADA